MQLRSGIAPAPITGVGSGNLPAPPPTASAALAEALDARTVVGTLWHPEGEHVRCTACGHRCLLAEGRRGVCKVRFHRAGQLRVPFGYVAGVQSDPVEKKPFFQVYPGSDALTFGMLGCDFHCAYCQNWVTSQALRDPASTTHFQDVSARELAELGRRRGARLVVSSYNEPLITAEWAVAVFQEAKAAGLECAVVSNGHATPEALEFLRPWIVACKVDLKSFDPQRYRSLGGTLDHVTQTIRLAHRAGLWVEVVTLLVPGFNDNEAELRQMAAFLAGVSPDIPWHLTAFHPDYHLHESPATTAAQLTQAAALAKAAGLRFVYAGNASGRVGPLEDTHCPRCGERLITRRGYVIRDYRLTPDGHCPQCAAAIPGLWPTVSLPAAHRGRAEVLPRTPRHVL